MSCDEITRLLRESGVPASSLFAAKYVALAVKERGWVGGTLRRFVFDPETVAILVRAAAADFGISPYELMRLAGLHAMSLCKWSNGQCRPKLESVESIGDALVRLSHKVGGGLKYIAADEKGGEA